MIGKKVAIVTGAARGIGAATVKTFAAHGYTVVAIDILEEDGLEVAREIQTQGGDCVFYACDVADEKRVREVIDKVIDRYGRVDALVNNAGIVLVKPLEEIQFAEYQRTFDVNVGGIFLMTVLFAWIMALAV